MCMEGAQVPLVPGRVVLKAIKAGKSGIIHLIKFPPYRVAAHMGHEDGNTYITHDIFVLCGGLADKFCLCKVAVIPTATLEGAVDEYVVHFLSIS